MTYNLTDEQIAQEWADAVEAHRPNMITTVTEFARSIAALVAEQQPATVLPNFPDLGEGKWTRGTADATKYSDGSITVRWTGAWHPAVPADPDADVKKALADSVDLTDAEDAGLMLADLRAKGFDIVRKAAD